MLFIYDAYGDTTATGGYSYGYNSWLKLTSMNNGQVLVGYNGFGQLVSKTTAAGTTRYLIDDLSPTGYPQVVAEVVNGQPVRTYTYGLERISELQTVNNAPTASYYQYDGRGTVRMLTNAAGAVTDTYSYDAFGNLIDATGSTPNPYLYRGERYDADLGLYYLRARWYNPVTGRFMTRDPYSGSIYDPASLHRYNYARANPANFIDPSGRSAAVENVISFSLNTYAAAAAVTGFGYMIKCGYYALASPIHLVGQHLGQDISQLKLLWTQCAGRITADQFGSDFASNLLWLGTGEGIGSMLDGAAQGSAWSELPTTAEITATPFEQIMSALQGTDFSTAPNTALFYSGAGASDVAEALAADRGLTTISDTHGGAYLQSLDLYGPNSPVTRDEADQLWRYASQQYANGASGDVTAILNNPSPQRIYLTIERPILINNPNVNLTETLLFDWFLPAGNFH